MTGASGRRKSSAYTQGRHRASVCSRLAVLNVVRRLDGLVLRALDLKQGMVRQPQRRQLTTPDATGIETDQIAVLLQTQR